MGQLAGRGEGPVLASYIVDIRVRPCAPPPGSPDALKVVGTWDDWDVEGQGALSAASWISLSLSSSFPLSVA